jgi:outer membrane autotransporter protein
MSPGGAGRAMTTALTGNLVQSLGGAYVADIDFSTNSADRINVTGSAQMAGHVTVGRVNMGGVQSGTNSVTILSAAGGVTPQDLALVAPSSPVTTYQLLYPNANDVVLSYNVNFQPANLPAQFLSIGAAINQIQQSGQYPGFAPIANALMGAPSIAALANLYNAIGGGGTTGTQNAAFAAGSMILSSMFDRTTSWSGGTGGGAVGGSFSYADTSVRGADAFAQLRLQDAKPNRWQVWVSGMGGKQTVDASSSAGTPGLSQTVAVGTVGVDRQISRDALVGFSIGASDSNFSVPDRITSGGSRGVQFGAYAMSRSGSFYLKAALAYGSYDNYTQRTIAGVGPAQNARGDFDSQQFAGRIEVGHRIQAYGGALTPFASVEFLKLWQNAYSEINSSGGSSTLGLSFPEQSSTSLPASLGVQFDSRFALSNGTAVTPFARIAWVHEFNPNRSITAAFNVAPGVNFITSGARMNSDFARFDVGARADVARGLSLFARLSGEIAAGSQTYSAVGGYKMEW